MYAFYPSVCEQLCTSLAVSMDERIKVCFILERHYIEKPDLFIQMFKDKMNEFLSKKGEIEQMEPNSEVASDRTKASNDNSI